jgi:hypothetical protein
MKYMLLFWVDEPADVTADDDAAMMIAVKSWVEQLTERGQAARRPAQLGRRGHDRPRPRRRAAGLRRAVCRDEEQIGGLRRRRVRRS